MLEESKGDIVVVEKHGGGLLDVGEAAAYLNTTERHIRRLRNEMRLPYVKVGSKLRFLRDDLDAYVEANKHSVYVATPRDTL